MKPPNYKQHLGADVYVIIEFGSLTLYTSEDGVMPNDIIQLDGPTWRALVEYVKQLENVAVLKDTNE